MKRVLPVVILLVLAGVAVYLATGSGGGPPPAPGTGPETTDTDPVEVSIDPVLTDASAADDAATRRSVDTGRNGDDIRDPEYTAALSGFRGRVVDSDRTPVADTLVHLYAFSADSVFVPDVDVFVDESTAEPRIDAGEARTGDDGRFEILRVQPRSLYLLHAAVDHDSPAWKIVERTPGPGEVIDLGDIVLQDLGVLVGEVVGPDGKPVEGALVRAVDLPGSVLTFVPLERLDPHGALIITEDGGHVITAPAWFAPRFEQLPIARTRSGPDGRFRLTGVIPGGNLVAVTSPGLLSNVRPRVLVEPGEEKDLGTLRLPEGEFAFGKVVDEEGEPIAGAEVLVATTSPSVPVHLASFASPTDAEGVFELGGLPARDAVVAARRGPGDPWQIAGPQPVTEDFEIRLPSRHTLTLRVTGPKGESITKPRLQLLPGELGQGALELAMWGVTRPVPLADRVATTEDGATVVRDLRKGRYALMVSAAGCATTAVQVDLTADAEKAVELAARVTFTVQVLDPSGKPVRHADIYVEARGPRPRVPDMPIHAGRSGRDGTLAVDDVHSREAVVVASHPAFGSVRQEVELPREAPVILQFAVPGRIEGVLTDGGAAPNPPGKWTVSAIHIGRGGFDRMPRLAVPDTEGRFHFAGLTPGEYLLAAIPTLDVVTSPGKMLEFGMGMRFTGDPKDRRVEVAPGETATVAFDATAEEPIDGPAARVTGFATLDGRPAEGCILTGWGQGRRLFAEVDASGRFDLGLVPVGSVHLELQERPSMDPFSMDSRRGELWQRSIQIEAGKDLDLVIEILTSAIAGEVVHPDGRPAPQADVRLSGHIPDEGGQGPTNINFRTRTDERGRFEVERITAANYTIEVRADGHRAQVRDVVAAPGAAVRGIRIELHRTYTVRGTVDVPMFGDEKPRWMWLQLVHATPEGAVSSQSGGVDRDGRFEVQDLEPGSYTASLYFRDERQRFDPPFEHPTPIVVVDRDLDDVTLRPVPRQEDPEHRHEQR